MTVRGYRDGSLNISDDDQGDTITGVVIVDGVADLVVAKDQAKSWLAPFFGSLKLTNVTAEHVGAGVWECPFTYSVPDESGEQPEIGDIEWELQPSVVTVTEYNAITEITYRKNQPPTNDFYKKVIGVQQEGPPEGVEKQYATAAYIETHYIDPQLWTIAVAKEWFDRIILVNNAPYHGFGKQELLFLGATAKVSKGITILPVTFTWAYSKNEPNLTIGEIQNINKFGWGYLWAQYIKIEAEEFAVRDPHSVSVNGIYYEEDMNGWGIGNPHD